MEGCNAIKAAGFLERILPRYIKKPPCQVALNYLANLLAQILTASAQPVATCGMLATSEIL